MPRNNVQVQVAPFSSLFETLPAHERLTTIANHELTHVATMDQATGTDHLFRRLFSGKVNPVAEQPESILYFYLTSPRVAVPSWYQEGVAVFVETWMGAGVGRAQSGYDEMVFRAMVKDGSRFYDPLGLVSSWLGSLADTFDTSQVTNFNQISNATLKGSETVDGVQVWHLTGTE